MTVHAGRAGPWLTQAPTVCWFVCRADAPALDLNDDKQVFELLPPPAPAQAAAGGKQRQPPAWPPEILQLVDQAAALVIEPQTQVVAG